MTPRASGPREPVALLRTFGRADLIAVTINAVVGAGIFGLPSKVFALIGTFSLVAFLVCALFAGLIVLCFAEVGSRFSGTGGPYLYVREAFGPTAGFGAGWLMWLARVSAFAANSNLLVGYAAWFYPPIASPMGRNVFLCAVTLFLVAVNITGVRHAARLNNLFTAGKLIPLAVLIAVGLWFVNWPQISFPATPSWAPFSSSVLLLVYAFTGFEMAVIPGGEIRDPRRTIPVALITAIAVIAVLYILLQIVCIGVLPGLAASQRPIADAAARILGPTGAAFISAGIVISITGNLHITLLSASRIPFAMGERAELPSWLGKAHPRFRTPHLALLLTGCVVLALSLSGTFVYAVTISSLARLATYSAVAASLVILRRQPGAPAAALRLPGGPLIPGAAILLALWLLSNSTWREARDTALAAALGFAIYFYNRNKKALA